MYKYVIVIFSLFLPSIAFTNPSTTSLELSGLEVKLLVAKSSERHDVGKNQNYWTLMPNFTQSNAEIRISQLVLQGKDRGDPPIQCDIRDCTEEPSPIQIVSPGETLFLISKRRVLEIGWELHSNNAWEQLKRIQGLFATSCQKENNAAVEKVLEFSNKQKFNPFADEVKVSLVPIPTSIDEEIIVECLL